MSDNVLVATTGRLTGSPASRRLRATDAIPAVIYGHGMAPVPVTIERRDLRLAVSGPAGMNSVLSIEVDGQSFAALVKEVQRHPVRRTVSHVDFIRVNLDEEITVLVPIRLVGEAKAVLNAGGLVDPAVDTIEVVTTPGQMPSEIVIDISALVPGQVLHLRDIEVPAGSRTVGDPDMAVVLAMISSTVEAPARVAVESESADKE